MKVKRVLITKDEETVLDIYVQLKESDSDIYKRYGHLGYVVITITTW